MSKIEVITNYYNDMLKGDGVMQQIYEPDITKMMTYQPPVVKSEAVLYCEKHFPETTLEFKRLMEKQYELFCKKQLDYGPSNIALGTNLSKPEQIKASITGVIFRTNDKIQRLLNLFVINQREAANESVEDSFMDIVNYGIIAQIVKNGKWGK